MKIGVTHYSRGSHEYIDNETQDLVREIAEDRVILYVGAGVSQSSGYKSWKELLDGITAEARGPLENEGPVASEYFKGMQEASRNLELGDWLFKLIGERRFPDVLERVLLHNPRPSGPSDIHHNLVRLPFNMIVTTNYDDLLTTAYEELLPSTLDPSAQYAGNGKPPVHTWQDTNEILPSVQKRGFSIVHAHGRLSGKRDTLILTGSQYRKMQEFHPSFSEIMKWLLKTKTFLFFGAGLQDPDFIYQLQEAIAEHGKSVGPHYALLPIHEAPQMRMDILRDSLHVKVIPIGTEEQKAKVRKAGSRHQSRRRYAISAAPSLCTGLKRPHPPFPPPTTLHFASLLP